MNELASITTEELGLLLEELHEPKFRTSQVMKWLAKGVPPKEMLNIPKTLREKLSAFPFGGVGIIECKQSKKDDTAKMLYETEDGNVVEGVLMRYSYGNTLCISTQAGCRMGCRFCASTLNGRVRDLTAGEMLGQVLAVNRMLAPEGRRVHNIVLMGSGEPLDNYDNVIRFLHLVNAPEGLNISLRNISLSTCGLVPNMLRLAEENLPVTLSVSLHAPNDEIRRTMMPVANVYPMDDLLQACRNYVAKTGRRVIFEYALVAGVNCEDRHADELARKLRGLQCHVNLIPLNSVKERNLMSPGRALAERFQARLTHDHISATIRREMGADIDGACGQLRRRVLQEKKDT